MNELGKLAANIASTAFKITASFANGFMEEIKKDESLKESCKELKDSAKELFSKK